MESRGWREYCDGLSPGGQRRSTLRGAAGVMIDFSRPGRTARQARCCDVSSQRIIAQKVASSWPRPRNEASRAGGAFRYQQMIGVPGRKTADYRSARASRLYRSVRNREVPLWNGSAQPAYASALRERKLGLIPKVRNRSLQGLFSPVSDVGGAAWTRGAATTMGASL
jgi:hypothetical protein